MTYGMELIDDPETGECLDHAFREAHSWPGRLGDFFGADLVVNDAVISGSNARIVRSTIDWVCANGELLASEPGLVVIGWSGAMRREFFVDGAYRQVIPYQEHRPAALDELVRTYRATAWHDADDAARLITDILSLQAFLKFLGVPYVYFDAIEGSYDCLGRGGIADSPRVAAVDTRRFLGFGEQKASMAARLRGTSLPWVGKHPSVEGHEFWASELAAFVMEGDLIKPDGCGGALSSSRAAPPHRRRPWAKANRTFIYP